MKDKRGNGRMTKKYTAESEKENMFLVYDYRQT